MDFEFEKQWRETIKIVSKKFEEDFDIQTILFLIGVQELNKGYQNLSKDQKIDVMHIGLCTILEPFGYYESIGKDRDGWLHFKQKIKLPNTSEKEQERIIKEAIIGYFNSAY